MRERLTAKLRAWQVQSVGWLIPSQGRVTPGIRGTLGSFGNHRILSLLRGQINRLQVSSAGRHAEET
jgi:hypothetical protein